MPSNRRTSEIKKSKTSNNDSLAKSKIVKTKKHAKQVHATPKTLTEFIDGCQEANEIYQEVTKEESIRDKVVNIAFREIRSPTRNFEWGLGKVVLAVVWDICVFTQRQEPTKDMRIPKQGWSTFR